jgi:hypothetical protein
VLAPRTDPDFSARWILIGYLTTAGLRGKDPFLCPLIAQRRALQPCNIAGTWGSASGGEGPRKPAGARGYLVDGPKDRENPVSGMAKHGRIGNWDTG